MADSAHSTEATHDLTATTQPPHDDHAPASPLDVSGEMVLWTWILFAVMAVVLYKIAWKPILGMLEKREQDIQDSMDNAVRILEELDGIDAKRVEILAKADEKSKAILEAARKGSQEQAKIIEAKARDEALILMENANREIETKRAKAAESLRVESAAWARELAGKLIEANLDSRKNKALTDKLIQEL